MKKSLSRGQLPCLAVKGKGLIHAPSECVLQFLLNNEISRKVDELLNEGMNYVCIYFTYMVFALILQYNLLRE